MSILRQNEIQLCWYFYPAVWKFVPYPREILTWNHIWFVVYLFVLYLLSDWFVCTTSITSYFLGFFQAGFHPFGGNLRNIQKAILNDNAGMYTDFIPKPLFGKIATHRTGRALNIYALFSGSHILSIILTTIQFARCYLNFSNKYLTYLISSGYPLYILYQTVIVSAGYYTTQWESPVRFKLTALIIVYSV